MTSPPGKDRVWQVHWMHLRVRPTPMTLQTLNFWSSWFCLTNCLYDSLKFICICLYSDFNNYFSDPCCLTHRMLPPCGLIRLNQVKINKIKNLISQSHISGAQEPHMASVYPTRWTNTEYFYHHRKFPGQLCSKANWERDPHLQLFFFPGD